MARPARSGPRDRNGLLAALEHLAQRYRNLDLDGAAARRARGSVPEQASEPGGGSAEDVGEVDAAPQILRADAGRLAAGADRLDELGD